MVPNLSDSRRFLFAAFAVLLLVSLTVGAAYRLYASDSADQEAAELDALENQVRALAPQPQFPDDLFILVALQEAIAAKREGSGGVGACLVQESTGKVIARGHNRQYSPYFRSDMHAEMDLMNRYEDSLKITRIPGKDFNPRQTKGLVLYSSVEPCPMCLARIINTGLKKTYYAAEDPSGGMVSRISDLPPFWKDAAAGRIYAAANCAPVMKEIAAQLFRHGRRNIRN